MFLLHNYHYWCIKAIGTKVPTTDPGNLILCKESHRASFEIEKVNALKVKEDDSDNGSDKYSEGDSREKILKKKIRKFVAEEEQKAESEMKNLSNEKTTSEKGSIYAFMVTFPKLS